jgi:hypothetical protein
MFGFRSAKEPAREKGGLDDVLARHKANLAAERKPPGRSDPLPPVLMKKVGFGKRSASSRGG